ncbi:2535_t:CDS:2, partial [Scutellospora calospora]
QQKRKREQSFIENENKDQDIVYENLEIDSIVEYIGYAIDKYQGLANNEKISAFIFGYIIDISLLEMLLKKIADFLIKHIEDADNYKWQFPVRIIAFITEIYNKLQKSKIKINEYGIDATYKTNDLGFELYALHAEVDRTRYPLLYLLLENNRNCKDGVRTSIIQYFLAQIYDIRIIPDFLLTDKDFVQMSAASFVWPETKI